MTKPTQPTLRRDLLALAVPGRRRGSRLIVDEIGGRFARIPDRLWQSLQAGVADAATWNQATAAGWTRHRGRPHRHGLNPFYIQIPLVSLDPLATALARHAGWLFAPLAVVAWCLLIAVAGLAALSRGGELWGSLGSLSMFLAQTDPLTLAAIFIATKVVHELGHAVACRRIGSRCGSGGLLLLCGIPCPYCDVTDIWRQGSAARRIAVMLAGIYLELIVASLATVTWLLASDAAVRLHAFHVMVVCGISTLVFNANPLMRYDGYYVLADWIGSTHLRQEARDAFRAVWVRWWAGPGYATAPRRDRRALGLALYHAASLAYRLIILAAILGLLWSVAEYCGLQRLATAALVLAAGLASFRFVRRLAAVGAGAGPWRGVSRTRRGLITLVPWVVLAIVLWVPLPRYRNAVGWIDAADATTVFLKTDGHVASVTADFGTTVRDGELLLEINSDPLHYQHAKLAGQLRVAQLRSDRARRIALERTEAAQQWAALQAAEQAIADQLAATGQRLAGLRVCAPHAGIVLPATATVGDPTSAAWQLPQRVGTVAAADVPWCRISRNGKLRAVIVLDGRDRDHIQPGTPVRVWAAGGSGRVWTASVDSVSAIRPDAESMTRESQYMVECRLPAAAGAGVLAQLGSRCQAVFWLPRRTLAAELSDWLGRWISGELS